MASPGSGGDLDLKSRRPGHLQISTTASRTASTDSSHLLSPTEVPEPYQGFYPSVRHLPPFSSSLLLSPSSAVDITAVDSNLPRPLSYYRQFTAPLYHLLQHAPVRRKRVYLMRHGETEPNNRRVLQGSGLDESLNARGLAQAKCLASYLDGLQFDMIVSSQLKRARETADQVYSCHSGAERVIVPELREICWGSWEGTRAPDMASLLDAWKAGDFEASAPGVDGESPMDCLRRAVPAMVDLVVRSGGDTIAIVAHGRLIRILLAYLLQGRLDGMSNFHHNNACINVLEVLHFSSPPSSSISLLGDDGGDGGEKYASVNSDDSIVWLPLVLNDYSHVPEELRNT